MRVAPAFFGKVRVSKPMYFHVVSSTTDEGAVLVTDMQSEARSVDCSSFPLQDYFTKLPRRHRPDFHWLFIGGASSITPLHVDPSGTHAWLTQIHGRKRFILFPPCDLPKLQKATGSGFKPLSEILAESVTPLEIVLNPGDTLFVPAHWPHQVECIDDSISVTWNFLGQPIFPLIRAAFLAHTARS